MLPNLIKTFHHLKFALNLPFKTNPKNKEKNTVFVSKVC